MEKKTLVRTALVTGASRGIGRGIALELGSAGFDIAVNYAGNRAAAEETCELISRAGSKAVPIQADIARTEDRTRLVDEAVDALGPLSLLVNNAGVAPRVRADILDADEESFDRLIGTNLKGPYFLTQDVARRMKGWKADGLIADTAIVFITSISVYTASVNRGDYCLSKAALAMAVKLFAARLGADGIGVYEIQPGIIETDMTSAVKEKYDTLIHEDGLLPMPRWGRPEDVGRAVVAIAEGRFPYSTGMAIPVDGGFHLRTL